VINSTNKKGEIAESALLAYLVKNGFNVLVPWGDKHRYDLVAEKDNVFKRIQVKYCTPRNGVLVVHCYSNTRSKVTDVIRMTYSEKEVDCIAVFDSLNEEIYFINSNVFSGKPQISLRVEDVKNNQSRFIRWADDFKSLE